uniref:Uncharacterized protein n=1 Tax=Eutreptiella gymnastica TaxID=73025 RepID=A0A7S4D395_9EUGL
MHRSPGSGPQPTHRISSINLAGVDEFLQGTTRAQSLAEHLHILDNDELGLDDRHWEREALHLQRLCAKYMDVMCSTADGLTKAEQHLEPYLELSDPQADALQTALFHIKDVRGQLQQQHTELQVKAPYALQHSADAECQTDAQQCVPDVPSPDRPMFLCDPDCCFIVYETLPFADDAPDVSCAEEPPRSLLQEPTEGPSVRWGGVDGCTTPDETSAVEVTNRLPEEQVPNQQQELKHLRAEPKLRVSADAVLPCLAPTPPEPSARTADPQNDPSPRLVKSPTKGSPHGAVQTPCAAAGVLAEEVALRSETVAEGEPRARTDNELVSLENEVEQLRQEVNAQRSQAALQIIQLRQEYEKKLDTFAMAQRQVQQREEEIKEQETVAAQRMERIRDLENELSTERRANEDLKNEMARVRSEAQWGDAKSQELHRLRTIMRFSQLKRDSDELHALQQKVQDLESQLERSKRGGHTDAGGHAEERLLEHVSAPFRSNPRSLSESLRADRLAPSVSPRDIEKKNLPQRVRALAADADIFGHSSSTALLQQHSMSAPPMSAQAPAIVKPAVPLDKRSRSASSPSSSRRAGRRRATKSGYMFVGGRMLNVADNA